MRIVFVGAVRFSACCLREVLDCGGNEVTVVALSPERSGMHSDYADLSGLAADNGLPCHVVQKSINDSQTVSFIRGCRPDVMFVFGWSQLIGPELLSIPLQGCLGSHPALLPLNRGRHPLIWALVEGLRESGLTFFYLGEGADDGDIVWQGAFSIDIEDDAETLYGKMEELGRQGIREFLPQLQDGTAPRRPQDHSMATYWGKRTKSDGEITWDGSCMAIYNLVRALARPYPGAHTYVDGVEVTVWRAELLSGADAESRPGTVLSVDESRAVISTGDGRIGITEYTAADGRHLEKGMRLGAIE